MLHRDAIKAYQTAEQEFLVEGADPHGLVKILYTELLASLERAADALKRNDFVMKSSSLSKALTILHVLASSLDFERGGEIATSLAQLYDWARRKVIAASSSNACAEIADVQKTVAEIASAWDQIAHTRAA